MKGRYGECEALTVRGFGCMNPATGWLASDRYRTRNVCLRHHTAAVEGRRLEFVPDDPAARGQNVDDTQATTELTSGRA